MKDKKNRGLIAKPSTFHALSRLTATFFQDRWFQPLTHTSDNDFNYLRAPCRLAFPPVYHFQQPERIRHVALFQVYIPLVHRNRLVPRAFHGNVHVDVLPDPVGLRNVPVVVEAEVRNLRPPARRPDSSRYHVLCDCAAVVAREDETVDVRYYLAALPVLLAEGSRRAWSSARH